MGNDDCGYSVRTKQNLVVFTPGFTDRHVALTLMVGANRDKPHAYQVHHDWMYVNEARSKQTAHICL